MTFKKILCSLSFLTLSKFSFAQKKIWEIYDLDSLVTVEMPYSVYEIDTLLNNQKLYQIYSINNSTKYVAQKSFLGKLYSNVETIKIPHDEKSLEDCYSEFIWVLSEMFEDYSSTSQPIETNNLKGYKLSFKNKNGLKTQEIYLLIVNKNLYSFFHTNEAGLDESDSKYFFNSINFDSNVGLKQYYSKPSIFPKKIILFLFLILFLSFILRLKSKKRIRSN